MATKEQAAQAAKQKSLITGKEYLIVRLNPSSYTFCSEAAYYQRYGNKEMIGIADSDGVDWF